MKIIISLFLLAASLQEESLSLLLPAHIYYDGETKVHEGDSITFTCATDDITKSTGIIDMYLFKNGVRVKREAFEAVTKYNKTFTLTKLTPEHSGLYTCLYSEEKLRFSTANTTGHNSVSLKVLGKLLPMAIKITEMSVNKKETLKLTCTFTKIPNCTEVYVYLTFNGIGNSKNQVICSHTDISTTFQIIFIKENSGNYSCVYSVCDYSLSEVRNTGGNTIFVDGGDFFNIMPANIIITKVGQNLELKCFVPGLKPEFKLIHMYLCKNGVGLRMKLLREKNEHMFILKEVSDQDSGIYSCVYSLRKHNLSDLKNTTHKTIEVHIYGSNWERNLIRLILSVVVVIFACCVIIFDFKTRDHPLQVQRNM